MKDYLLVFLVFGLLLETFTSCNLKNESVPSAVEREMMVRMAEIEIVPEYVEEYMAILKEEAAASVRLEAGVICIYPMFQKENPTQVKLLEIYASKDAYEAHLKTPHFKHYKTATLPMVKNLRLLDMEAIDPENMEKIFAKL